MSDPVERVLMDQDGIKVTDARFMVGSKTYAMSAVAGVQHLHQGVHRVTSLISSGVMLAIAHHQPWYWTALGFACLAAWFYFREARHHVVLHLSGRQIKALTSTDKEKVVRIVDALNQAIVVRAGATHGGQA